MSPALALYLLVSRLAAPLARGKKDSARLAEGLEAAPTEVSARADRLVGRKPIAAAP